MDDPKVPKSLHANTSAKSTIQATAPHLLTPLNKRIFDKILQSLD